jgi:O-antigen ligase
VKRISWPAGLLMAAILLAIVFGGQVASDASPLAGSFSDLLSALFGSGELATLPHALITLMVAVSVIGCLLQRRIIQCPPATISVAILSFFGLIILSVLVSSFKSTSVPIALEWSAYGLAFFATTALVGRRLGPRAMLATYFGGSVWVAVRGVMEYGQNKAIDPSWRIFAGWVNPNATAAALLIGLFAGLVLVAQSERIGALLSGLGVVLVVLAIALTGSKGGLLALGAGLAVFFVLTLVWSSPKSILKPALIIGLSVAVVLAMQFSQSAPASAPGGGSAPSALGRIANAGNTADQSAGFRKLLWQGQIDLMRENPIGFGIGTYRFWSARPGLTTQTHLGHQAFLQLGVEAGVLTPLILGIFAVLWLLRICRGVRKIPKENGLALAGVVATVTAIGAQSFVDSDLYYYGIGMPFFALLGLGLLLATDAVSPEFVPKTVRLSAVAFAAVIAIASLFMGYTEAVRARLRNDLATADLASAQAGSSLLASIAPYDGEALYLRARIAPAGPERLELATKTCVSAPSPRNLRFLAREQLAKGDQESAISTLNRALLTDPSNFPTLSELLELYRTAGNEEAARQVAERLVAVEATPYFQVRSLPEIVPVDTFKARLYLAGITKDVSKRVELLSGAVQGFLSYANSTAPTVRRALKDEPNGNYAGESLQSVNETLRYGQQAAEQLALAQRAAGDITGAETTEATARDFASKLSI